MKLLVMDDEPEIVTFLISWLRERGHSADAVSSPEMLRRFVSDRSYDVVLLDLMMPWANGLSLIEDIRERSPNTSVIVISAIPDTRVVVSASQQGADGYIVKPIDFAQLERALAEVERVEISKTRTYSDAG